MGGGGSPIPTGEIGAMLTLAAESRPPGRMARVAQRAGRSSPQSPAPVPINSQGLGPKRASKY
jgi:hypothetical protein